MSKLAQRKTFDIQFHYLKSLRDNFVIFNIIICVRNRAEGMKRNGKSYRQGFFYNVTHMFIYIRTIKHLEPMVFILFFYRGGGGNIFSTFSLLVVFNNSTFRQDGRWKIAVRSAQFIGSRFL